jgi:titin
MAIVWGGYSQHERVGIDIRHDSYNTNTTAINVYADYYVGSDGWGFADNQTYHFADSWGSGSWAFYMNTPNVPGQPQTKFISTRHVVAGLNYSPGPVWGFNASISGSYLGGAPSVSRSWQVPARPANVPTQPGISAGSVTNNSARITVSAADGRGSGIQEYQSQVDNNSNFASPHLTWGGGSGTVTGLAAATTYYARTRARNGVGWGAWSGTISFTTGATIPTVPQSVSISNVEQTSARLNFVNPASTGGSALKTFNIQYATNSGFTAGVKNFDDGTTPAELTDLTPGTPYWARVRATNGVGPGPWSAAQAFTTLAGTPEFSSPANNATVSNGILDVTIKALGIIATKSLITVEVSQDSTFATGVTTETLTPAAVASNSLYRFTKTAVYLKSGDWYMRSKVTNLNTGYITPWSTTLKITQAHQPSVSLQSPVTGSTVRYEAQTVFQWRFTDAANPNDVQSAYQLVIEDNLSGDVVYDSGKVALVSSASNPTVSRSVAIPEDKKNDVLRWRVKVWDKGDTESGWTGWGLFTLADPPVVTVITPAPSLPVDNGAPTFSWEFTAPSGGTQALAVIEVFDDANNELIWTDAVVGQATQVTPQVVVLINARSYHFRIEATDSLGLTGVATGAFETEYIAPDILSYSVNVDQVDENGYVSVTWVDAAPDPLFAAWKVYRRNLPDTTWKLIGEVTNQNTREFRDYMVSAGSNYAYSVTQAASRSGILLESPVGYYVPADDPSGDEQVENRVYFIDLTHYWLIDPDNPQLSVRLQNVISDDSTLEYESETSTIIGRGRHRDYGDRLGYTGSIVCQARGTERPNRFRLAIEAMRNSQESYYYRTPFGRLFEVALGNIGWSPLPGTGTSEMGDITIPYEEVG